MADETLYSDITMGIVATLRANITDPDTTRSAAGKQFIYPDFPNINASMPRISCTLINGDTENMDVKEPDELVTFVMQIDVWCHVKTRFTIEGTGYSNTRLRDYLAGQVTKVMKKQRHALFSAYNIVDIRTIRHFGPMDSGDEKITRSMAEFEIQYHQTYS